MKTILKFASVFVLFVIIISIYGCSKEESNPVNTSGNSIINNLDEKKATSGGATSGIFFDDFIYKSSSDPNLTSFGWTPRTGTGGPDPSTGSTTWSANYITFPSGQVNTVLEMKASISGTNIVQSELDYSTYKMLNGTFAGYVYYTDAPDVGANGSAIDEAPFWTMSNYNTTSGTNNYSELDFEYYPNGAYGSTGHQMWNTTWYNDVQGICVETETAKSFAGWHLLVITCANGVVSYYDGSTLLATASGKYYPRSPMQLIPQLWFTADDVTSTWHVLVDWLYFAADQTLTATQVQANVNALRASGVARENTLN